jgi:N-acetylmuramoyl-L-alanine amidase
VWGKIIGAMAGFAMGGPFGAVVGAALGHAAESGGFSQMRFGLPGANQFGAARMAALLGQREQYFAVASVVLSAKLAKCDGPVNRAEIDAFKRSFRIPPEAAAHVGRLFDQARASPDGYETYAKQMGESFADNRGMLEEVLAALFLIARADKPLTVSEQSFLRGVHLRFGLDDASWERASAGRPDRGGSLCDPRVGARRQRRAGARHLAATDARQPSGRAGRAWRAARIHRPRQRQGGPHQRRLGPHQKGARPVTLPIRDLPSPNQDDRPDGCTVDMVILHYTGMRTAREAIERLRDPAAKVSSHYVVDEDGSVLRLVAEARRAFHAGVSYWRGQRALNGRSIGIEIANPGHEFGYRDFPVFQLVSVCDLCLEIMSRHAVPARNFVAHSDVAPDRKEDPGEKFDWEGLARNGVGLWPEGVPDLGTGGAVRDAAALRDVRAALAKIGYEVAPEGPLDPALATVLRAFQRHWRGEAVNGQADAGTLARLLAVARMCR